MFFWTLFLSFFLSRECGLYKAIDLLLEDHVCDKSDAVYWIDCPRLSFVTGFEKRDLIAQIMILRYRRF